MPIAACHGEVMETHQSSVKDNALKEPGRCNVKFFKGKRIVMGGAVDVGGPSTIQVSEIEAHWKRPMIICQSWNC